MDEGRMELLKEIALNSQGLVPVIIQDVNTNKVLMMAWMNEVALKKTIDTGKTHFWSRSRQKLWLKGETSGHYQLVKEIYIDCDGDTLLIKVDQIKAACHTGYRSCFFRKLDKEGKLKIVEERVFDPRKTYKAQ